MPKNVLDTLVTLWSEHTVEVHLPHRTKVESLILIECQAQVSLYDLFMTTYGDAVTDLHAGLAEKVFGKEKTWVEFGVFINPDSRTPVYAFCRNFADFEAGSYGRVVFKDIDDVILKLVNTTPVKITVPKPPKRPTGGFGGGMVVRYAVTKRPDGGSQ